MRIFSPPIITDVNINKVGGIPEISRVIYQLTQKRDLYQLELNQLASGWSADEIKLLNVCIGDEKLHIISMQVMDFDLDQPAAGGCYVYDGQAYNYVTLSYAKTGYVTSGGRGVAFNPAICDLVFNPVPERVGVGAQYMRIRTFIRLISFFVDSL